MAGTVVGAGTAAAFRSAVARSSASSSPAFGAPIRNCRISSLRDGTAPSSSARARAAGTSWSTGCG
ncbi:hypothetical protein ABIH81_02170 [Micromonospora sp. HUAS YX12]|uniref:Secreted protein n=1 Tax=Micromonospora sp. HUAS YX12 TaxID=3156396 RepID=A0AAU7R2H5_9ACTN